MTDGLQRDESLDEYPHLHAARGDLLRRLGRRIEAATAYRRAVDLTENRTERAFLQGRLAEVSAEAVPGRPS